jgi:sugar O-acyltransferase (sialic acid O-acetyltransferase NeuD family)
MSTNKVIIFGTNDLAELSHFYLTNDTTFEVVGFTIHKKYIKNSHFQPRESETKYPIIPFEEIEISHPPTDYLLFAPMTGTKMNENRKNVYFEGKNKGYRFISYVSSKATILNSKIGENCFILENNTIQPFVEIGNNVIMWSGNHIGHHGKIDSHCFFTSHVVLSGHCHVKERCWFGVNSTIRDGLTIEEGTLVAMGSLITKNTESFGFYLGNPAKKQEKKSTEIY